MLQIEHVSKTFNPGTINEKKALIDLNVSLKDGDFATIVGSNGAGKSTMFNAITGAFYVDEGEIVLDHENITYKQEHLRSRSIGHLFQDPLLGTAPHMTIEENMSLAYLRASNSRHSFWGRSRKKERDFFREQLSLLDMGLEDRMKNPVGLLSGGQRQALTLLMATMVTPKLLLLDEHTAALDPKTSKVIMEKTKQLIDKQHITAMMISHNLRDAVQYADRIIMLDKGKIILDVESKKITESELVKIYNSKIEKEQMRAAG